MNTVAKVTPRSPLMGLRSQHMFIVIFITMSTLTTQLLAQSPSSVNATESKTLLASVSANMMNAILPLSTKFSRNIRGNSTTQTAAQDSVTSESGYSPSTAENPAAATDNPIAYDYSNSESASESDVQMQADQSTVDGDDDSVEIPIDPSPPNYIDYVKRSAPAPDITADLIDTPVAYGYSSTDGSGSDQNTAGSDLVSDGMTNSTETPPMLWTADAPESVTAMANITVPIEIDVPIAYDYGTSDIVGASYDGATTSNDTMNFGTFGSTVQKSNTTKMSDTILSKPLLPNQGNVTNMNNGFTSSSIDDLATPQSALPYSPPYPTPCPSDKITALVAPPISTTTKPNTIALTPPRTDYNLPPFVLPVILPPVVLPVVIPPPVVIPVIIPPPVIVQPPVVVLPPVVVRPPVLPVYYPPPCCIQPICPRCCYPPPPPPPPTPPPPPICCACQSCCGMCGCGCFSPPRRLPPPPPPPPPPPRCPCGGCSGCNGGFNGGFNSGFGGGFSGGFNGGFNAGQFRPSIGGFRPDFYQSRRIIDRRF